MGKNPPKDQRRYEQDCDEDSMRRSGQGAKAWLAPAVLLLLSRFLPIWGKMANCVGNGCGARGHTELGKQIANMLRCSAWTNEETVSNLSVRAPFDQQCQHLALPRREFRAAHAGHWVCHRRCAANRLRRSRDSQHIVTAHATPRGYRIGQPFIPDHAPEAIQHLPLLIRPGPANWSADVFPECNRRPKEPPGSFGSSMPEKQVRHRLQSLGKAKPVANAMGEEETVPCESRCTRQVSTTARDIRESPKRQGLVPRVVELTSDAQRLLKESFSLQQVIPG
jgi:hypothetical protein